MHIASLCGHCKTSRIAKYAGRLRLLTSVMICLAASSAGAILAAVQFRSINREDLLYERV